jgi:hypothetical protein
MERFEAPSAPSGDDGNSTATLEATYVGPAHYGTCSRGATFRSDHFHAARPERHVTTNVWRHRQDARACVRPATPANMLTTGTYRIVVAEKDAEVRFSGIVVSLDRQRPLRARRRAALGLAGRESEPPSVAWGSPTGGVMVPRQMERGGGVV